MRIGVDVRSLLSPYSTGVSQYTAHLLAEWAREPQGHEFFLFANARREMPRRILQLERPHMHLALTRFPNKILNPAMAWLGFPSIERLMKAGSIDVFFTPNWIYSAHRRGTPHVLTVHDLSVLRTPEHYSLKQRLWHRAIRFRRLIRRATHLIAVSEATRFDLMDMLRVPEEKITVIASAADEKFFVAPEAHTLERVQKKYVLPKKFFLTVASHDTRKNLEGVIEAFTLACSKYGLRDQALVIAGPPGLNRAVSDRLERAIAASGEKERIHLIGFVSEVELPALYRLASAFVFPSFYEGFGLPVVEAMAAGTPVITANCSSLPEVAGDAAILVDPYNLTDLARAMSALASDPVLCETLRTRGRLRAREFSWKKTAELTLSVLEKNKKA